MISRVEYEEALGASGQSAGDRGEAESVVAGPKPAQVELERPADDAGALRAGLPLECKRGGPVHQTQSFAEPAQQAAAKRLDRYRHGDGIEGWLNDFPIDAEWRGPRYPERTQGPTGGLLEGFRQVGGRPKKQRVGHDDTGGRIRWKGGRSPG